MNDGVLGDDVSGPEMRVELSAMVQMNSAESLTRPPT